MGEQNGQGAQGAQGAPGAAGAAAGAASHEGDVVLTGDQYNALLDRMQELEGLVVEKVKGGGAGKSAVDHLVEEGKGKGDVLSPETVEQFTPQQIIQYVMQAVDTQLVKPIVVKIEQIRLEREIEKCAGKHDDFWQYKDAIYRIGVENPTLSLEKAYKLAKDQAMEQEEGGGEKSKTGGEVILRLPNRPQPRGEKPGAALTSTKLGDPATVREAAERAWDDLEHSKKE